MIAKYVKLIKSQIEGKKYTAIFYDDERNKIKTTHFGASGMMDYTKFAADIRDNRKQAYISRHKNNEKWNDPMTSGSLAFHILWNKPTILASYNDYLKKFNLSKY